MKELFGYDSTSDRKNHMADCMGYESKRISAELEARIDTHNDSAEELNKQSELPPLLKALIPFTALGAFALGAAILQNIGKLTIKQMYSNAPWLFWVGGVCAVVFAFLLIYSRRLARSTEDSYEFEEAEAASEEILAEAKKELGIPENAEVIDGLMYRYKVKNGENKLIEEVMGHFIRSDCYVFSENDRFVISDSAVRFDIPLADISGIRVENKKRYMMGWGKEESFKSERFKEYCYKETDNLDRVWLRSTCLMYFKLKGEEFCFRFPTYELDTVESLTGIKAER